jgi:hypothetical protein
MPTDHSLAAVNRAALQQGIDVIKRHGTQLYARETEGAPSRVGAHFRHVLDHYEVFFAGLPGGRIDYDARERDPAVELDPARAIASAESFISRLAELGAKGENRLIEVNVAEGDHSAAEPVWTRSSIQRELSFLMSHTVHHYVLIALHAREAGVDLGEEFGVAPSTLAYWKRSLAPAEH